MKTDFTSPNSKSRPELAWLLVTSLVLTSTGFAQDDGDLLPPPPPPPSMGNFDGGRTNAFPPPAPPPAPSTFNRGRVGSGKNDTGLLTTEKRDKLNTAGIEDMTNENFPETIESFDFPNADIQDIVKAISELTGRNFIIDPAIRGKITIIAPSKVTVAEAYKAFLSALAINGYAVVPYGKFWKIRNTRSALRDSVDSFNGAYYPNADQFITRVIHLKYIQADSVKQTLGSLTSKDGEFFAYPATNSLIITDFGTNIERVMKIITQLDVQGFDDQIEVLPVRYTRAKDIADLIDKIINKGDKSKNTSNGFSSGVPRFNTGYPQPSTGNQKGSAYFTVIPDDRTNSLIVSGNKDGFEKVRKLLKQLDFRIRPEDQGGVHVYYVRYGVAEDIEKTLTGVIKDNAPKPTTGGSGSTLPGAPVVSATQGVVTANEIFGGEVKIKSDKTSNSLVIVASKQDYEVVLNILARLDIPRDQVYVEAIIMEMNVDDSSAWNLGYFKYAGNSGAHSGFNALQGSGPNSAASLLTPQGGSGAILGFGSGDQLSITPVGSTTPVTIPSLLGLISFLKTNQKGNILSQPQILALDNQEATIVVGDRVVTGIDQTTVSGGTTQVTPKLEDAAITLKIKPYISPRSNTVRLEIDQQVQQLSSVNPPKAFADQIQAVAKRNVKTVIVVNSGDTAVLGGLVKEQDIQKETKVPLLGDIPIIGWLFKSHESDKNKTNLTIFLTPKILRTPVEGELESRDMHAQLNRAIDRHIGFVKDTGGMDPFGKTIDSLMKKDAAAQPEMPSRTQ